MEKITLLFKSKGDRIVIVCQTCISETLIEGVTILHYTFKINSKASKESVNHLLLKEIF